jgi:hypothetical protein
MKKESEFKENRGVMRKYVEQDVGEGGGSCITAVRLP